VVCQALDGNGCMETNAVMLFTYCPQSRIIIHWRAIAPTCAAGIKAIKAAPSNSQVLVHNLDSVGGKDAASSQ